MRSIICAVSDTRTCKVRSQCRKFRLCSYSRDKTRLFLFWRCKLKTYIYPENLRANIKLWFWSVRDFIIICTGVILSVVSLVYLMNILPAAATLCYAFVSFRPDEKSILDFILTAFRFFCTSQQQRVQTALLCLLVD